MYRNGVAIETCTQFMQAPGLKQQATFQKPQTLESRSALPLRKKHHWRSSAIRLLRSRTYNVVPTSAGAVEALLRHLHLVLRV